MPILALRRSVPCSTSSMLESTSATRFLISSDRFLTSSATTANPFPCSPALAASMEALSERILVWSAIETIFPIHPLISFNDFWNSSNVFCISSKCVSTKRELSFSCLIPPCAWTTDWEILSFTVANCPDTVLILENVSPNPSSVYLKFSDSFNTLPKDLLTMLSSHKEETSPWTSSRW